MGTNCGFGGNWIWIIILLIIVIFGVGGNGLLPANNDCGCNTCGNTYTGSCGTC